MRQRQRRPSRGRIRPEREHIHPVQVQIRLDKEQIRPDQDQIQPRDPRASPLHALTPVTPFTPQCPPGTNVSTIERAMRMMMTISRNSMRRPLSNWLSLP